MKLSRAQLEQLHIHMQDLAGYTHDQEVATKTNIKGTNRVIYIFTLLGFIITVFIFVMFYQLSGAIDHSVKSMKIMENQAIAFRKTVVSITATVEDMGINVEQLYSMNNSVTQIAQQTTLIDTYLGEISMQTHQLSKDSKVLNQSSKRMESTVTDFNQSTVRIANALHETAMPIKQFIPVP